MKTHITLMTGLLLLSATVMGQEYKLSKSSGKLMLRELNHVTIEGYNGNEIVFTSLDGAREKDKRADGLRAVSASGLEDNTGLGLSVQDKGNTVEVFQLKKMDGPRVKIMVPKGVSVSYLHTSPYGDEVKIKNIESEIEISTVHNGVTLENVSGPMTVKTVHGEIEAHLSANVKTPVSIVSMHGLVDVTLPAAVKANISLSTNYGEIFVDPNIKIEFENQKDWTVYGANKVVGKINGGGVDITLSSSHGNLYVRKK